MKAIVSAGPKTSVVSEIPIPTVGDGQLLIRTKYVGVCMSEHYDWSTAQKGACFGHEPMGYVEKAGANITEFKAGDRVGGMWGGSLPGSGGMVQYNIADPIKDIVVKIPDSLTDEEAVLEPLSCMMSAVSKVRKNVPGTRAAVVGCGYMGCGAISLLKACEIYVTAVDIRAESLKNAERFGADEVYLYDEAKEKFSAANGFKGFEIVMEWGESNESLDLAINLTKTCGQLCIGAYHTGGKRLVDVQLLNLKAIECLSTHPREWDLNRTCAENSAAMLADGSWNFKGVPTKIYPFTQFDRAQSELETKYGVFMKSLIDMTAEDGEPYII